MAELTPIYDLLAAAQAEMKNPKMRGEGSTGKRSYKYAELPDVLNAIKPALNSRGLFLLQSTEKDDGGSLYISTRVCRANESVELDREYYEFDADPQDFGKRETYARRYSLNKAFGLAGEDDDDGNVQAQNPRNQKARQAPSKRQQWLARIAELKARCMELGVKEEGIDSYAMENLGTSDASAMTDEQMTSFGQYLGQLAKDMEQMKGE